MRLRLQLIFAALCGTALAQTTTSIAGSSATKTSSAAAQTWTVSVGKGDHTFRPETLLANVGDTVTFQFYPANHSVVRAEYSYPCIPYELTGKGKVGFFSGFHPVDAILDSPPSWSIKINDTNPIFYYCSAPGACIDYQMVGVINPNASVSLQTQKDGAKSSKYMLQPGDSFPVEGGTTLVPSGLPTATSTAAAAASSSSESDPHHSSFPPGAIAGVVIGVVVIIVLAAALFFYVGRAKSLKESVARQSIAPSMASFAFGKPGHMSPASPPPPPMPTGPIDYGNGTVFIPVKAADFNRASLPPYGGQMGESHPSPMRNSGGSPGPGVTYVPVSTYEAGNHGHPQTPNRGETVHNVTPVPAEMFAGSPKN